MAWMVSEATGYRDFPYEQRLRNMPLSQFQEFWDYQSFRNQRDSFNPAAGRQNETLIEMLSAFFGGKD